MKRPARRFANALQRALVLDEPAALARRILADPVDTGLRAASLEPRVGGTGVRVEVDPEDGTEYAAANSHPERQLEHTKPNTRRQLDDLRDLNRNCVQFCDAVAELVALCADRGSPAAEDYTWAWALGDASLLVTPVHQATCPHLFAHILRTLGVQAKHTGRCNCTSRLQDAEDVSTGLDSMAAAVHALTDIETLWKRYDHRRQASPWEQYKQAHPTASPEELCAVHATLRPPVFKPKHGKAQLCKTCADLARAAGGITPPATLVELLERGQQMDYRKARSRWIAECENDTKTARRGCA